MELRLNGEQRSADVDPRMLLVEALRDAFGAHGPKIGCLTGDCGACTVRVDGAIVKSCLKLAVAAEGADVQTLEGLADDGGLSALQQAFWDSHAFQCGYCLSGMLFAAGDLLERVDLAHRRGDPRGDQRQPVPLHRLRPDRRGDPLGGLMSELLPSPEHIPGGYRRDPSHTGLVIDRDVYVPMRDGVRLCVDVHRPETDEPLPALLAFAIYNKEIQTPEATAALPPQPAWSPLWTGPQEAGDTRFLVARGYVHVIGMPRGVGKSEGGGSREFDSYDLIEWIAQQPWCDGNVGMIGISGFGAEQVHVARQNPPSLKAIFPFDPRGAYGTLGGFREEYPGGVVHLFRYLVGHFGVFHQDRGAPGELPPEKEALWREAMDDPDYRMYPHVHNVVSMKGQHMPAWFEMLIDPFEQPGHGRAQRGGVRADPRSRPTRDRAGTATRTRRTSRAPRRTGGTCAASTRSCCSSAPRTSSGRSTGCTTRSCAGTTTG